MNVMDYALYNLIRPVAPDWFAARYRVQGVTRMLSITTPHATVSRIGVHCVGGNRSGFGTFLQTIDAANRKLALVTCYDDFGAAYECKQLWPDVLTVGMQTSTDYGFNYSKFVIKAKQNPWIDYWCIYNEIGGQTASEYARQANDYIALLPRMAADGLRLGMFSLASGTPPLDTEDGGACYAEIARACKFAVDNHYDALLCAHEYQSAGGTIGRYQHLRDYLIAHNAIIPLAISEWGNETFASTSSLMALVRSSDPIYMADQWCEGCANWTLGGGGWAGSNYAKALPDLGQYIATVAPIKPPIGKVTGVVTTDAAHKTSVEVAIYNAGGAVAWNG